ncbi:hypothetical protein J2W14_000050 [Pseudarthrobacter oxydans]|uniref:hypothetical protein n=1 Tax=Pseudarthrobacter oxydans TaxID=1671 RepID=UPI0027884B50|nr:hypothetical protein [Pseudarthrobacter oxydans]MDP9980674.1 hypothetical protein [Pseudarthrobacter oxydans]
MSAAAAANPVAVLRRAALLAGLLALIAGFLGMHIISGSHGPHAQSSPPGGIHTAPHATAPHAAGQAAADQTAGDPAGHSSHSAAGTFSQADEGPAAAETASAVAPATATVGGTQVPPSCTCQGGCAETPAVHVGCMPSLSGAPMSATHPGPALLEGRPWTAEGADRPSGYVYVPGTPTPRDLSISRT